MNDEPPDNVVRLNVPPSSPEKHVLPKSHCRHWQIEVDEDARTILCLRCKKNVDAFDMIVRYAFEEQRAFANLRRWKAQLAKLSDEYGDLERRVRNLKAQVRRQEKKCTGP